MVAGFLYIQIYSHGPSQPKTDTNDVNQITRSNTTSTRLTNNNKIYYKNKAVVLLYHDIDKRECGVAINKARFVSHMNMLQREGFNIVSLDDIISFIKKKKPLPPNAVAITFDDGCASNCTIAHKILKSNGWPYTVFVTVSEIGKTRPTGSLRLSEAQLKQMRKDGVTLGGHTFNGHFYISDYSGQRLPWLTGRRTGESISQYNTRVFQDLYKSRLALNKIAGTSTRHFAPPYGIYNSSVVVQAQKAGFNYIWSTQRIPVEADSSLTNLGRVSVGRKGTTARSLKRIILLTAYK